MSEYDNKFTRVASPLRPWMQGSMAAIIRDQDLSGGFRIVNTIEERDDIQQFDDLLQEELPGSNFRRIGMLCYVVETNITYRLTGDLSNDDWIEEHHNIGLTFETLELMNAYLINPERYAGQIATCQEEEGKLFVLSNSTNQWLLASQNEDDKDKHFVAAIEHQQTATINHNLNKKPAVTFLLNDGKMGLCEIIHIDENNVQLVFEDYYSGEIICN